MTAKLQYALSYKGYSVDHTINDSDTGATITIYYEGFRFRSYYEGDGELAGVLVRKFIDSLSNPVYSCDLFVEDGTLYLTIPFEELDSPYTKISRGAKDE